MSTWLTLAAALLRAGRPADAIAPLREAARAQPDDANILHDLGLACLEAGQIQDAIAALQAAIAARPRFADAHLRLGIALEAAGAVDAALASYRRAARIVPALADAQYRAGDLLDSLGRTEDAIAAWRRAAAPAPKTTLGRIATAKALLAEHRDAAAERTLRQALALEANNAVALELLGETLAAAGRFEEAEACLLQAAAASPHRAGCYYEAVRCRRIGPGDDALIGRMQAVLGIPGLEPAQRSRLHLALGKAHADRGDPARAMHHFDAAAELRDTITRFDLAAFEARVDRLIAQFPPERITAALATACQDTTPILILGLPRSGTTLVEQILSAHPAIAGGGELPFWNARAPALLASATPAELAAAAADYLRELRAVSPRAPHVTDKMPLNVQQAGLIHLALPRATIIHCHRHPADTALSIHQTHFNPRMAFPTGGAALVGYIRATHRLAAHWRHILPPARFIDVAYETLVTAPEPAIRRLIDAIGLPWHQACLHPEQNRRAVKTPSKFQARQPISPAAIGRRREYAPWLGALSALLDDAQVDA
jgi:tetratricopeptide (TPR) repeat protein